MWAPGALHDRLSRGAAIHHHACAEDVHAEGDAGFEFAGKSHRKPRLMKAGIIDSRPTLSVGMVERFHMAPPSRSPSWREGLDIRGRTVQSAVPDRTALSYKVRYGTTERGFCA